MRVEEGYQSLLVIWGDALKTGNGMSKHVQLSSDGWAIHLMSR